MKLTFHLLLLAGTATLGVPTGALGQNPDLVGSFRPYLFVLLAFAAGWLLIGAWVLQIGRKIDRLSLRMETPESHTDSLTQDG